MDEEEEVSIFEFFLIMCLSFFTLCLTCLILAVIFYLSQT